MEIYFKHSEEYLDFLRRTNTQESLLEVNQHLCSLKAYELVVNNATAQLNSRIQQELENASRCSISSKKSKSVKSHKSEQSNKSSISSILARKRAQAGAAQVGMEYLRKEADIRKHQAILAERQQVADAQTLCQQTALNADLDLLRKEREAAETVAEIQVLQAINDNIDATSGTRPNFIVPVESSIERTDRYVESIAMSPSHMIQPTQLFEPDITPRDISPPMQIPTPYMKQTMMLDRSITSEAKLDYKTAHLNPHALIFTPQSIDKTQSRPCNIPLQSEGVSPTTELTRFLLKKELLFSRLISYSDQPENYAIWKAGFTTIMKELQVTPVEELDLLVKRLGPESSKYALSLRAASVNNPHRGLQRVWDRLDERYGCPELVEAALKAKLLKFPKLTNKDTKLLYDLSDILSGIEATKEDEKYKTLLSYFDASSGVIPIVNKLPYSIQEKWTSQAVRYKRLHHVTYPPFSHFVEFIRDISKIKNDPSFVYESTYTQKDKPVTRQFHQRPTVSSKVTEISQESKSSDSKCPLHKTNHSLSKCRTFRAKPYEERIAFLKEHGICFRCCSTTTHMANMCTEKRLCSECNTDKHPTALHIYKQSSSYKPVKPKSDVGGERPESKEDNTAPVTSKCTQICGDSFSGKSCGKTILVKVYPSGHPEMAKKIYAIIDDQSNMSLARSTFFDMFSIEGNPSPYTLLSCAGHYQTSGRRATCYVVEALDGTSKLDIPSLIECNQIPDIRDEIPTPDVARNHQHLNDIVQYIPPLDSSASIQILIGRDVVEAHHVLDHRIGQRGSPYAQKLRLGWVIIGETCLGQVHRPPFVNVNKTNFLQNGRPSHFIPCSNNLNIKDNGFITNINSEELFDIDDTSSIFQTTKEDNRRGTSVEDRKFLLIMDNEVHKNDTGNLVAPLPFKSPRLQLPNNRPQAVQRAMSLHHSMLRNPTKQEHLIKFMQNVFDSGHAELAPPLSDGEECWFLPIFGIYHPKKPNQIRGVFDSSARYGGVSLNSVLLTGPDLTNSLVGILLRFRIGPIAVTADIQQMFHCFFVKDEHRNYLRFLWYKDNNPSNTLVDYRMCVHLFGNSPSPAVATYGLRHAAKAGKQQYGEDVVRFVERNFYVDDGLTSQPTVEEAIDLVQRTQEALNKGGKLRLHKIASNSPDVMKAFPSSDHAKDLMNLDFGTDEIPLQRSLGLIWNLKKDTFTYQVSKDVKPYTRRGILSMINGIFDPIGFIAPVIIQGKILLRDLMAGAEGWDEPLSTEREQEWQDWKDSLIYLESLQIPRTYSSFPACNIDKTEIHIFSDASEKAISAVAYQQTTNNDGQRELGFILGKAKLAPTSGHTIPCLELCGAVLAVEIAETISEHLDFPLGSMKFHTDSKVVLGYVHNESRRFFVYVSNRVERIRKSTSPQQWGYVPTHQNPADDATRSIPAARIQNSAWLLGPQHLNKDRHDDNFVLVEPDIDDEVRPQASVLKTNIPETTSLGSHRFEKFSSWNRLVEAIARLQHLASSFQDKDVCKGWHLCSKSKTVSAFQRAEQHVIKVVQQEVYSQELLCIRRKTPLLKDSPIISLSPVIVQMDLRIEERNPLIVPGKQHIATLLIRHHHGLVKHQGRHFTEGAVRAAGLWITGVKRLISSLIHDCVKCRKLRGAHVQQKMSDLPVDRLTPAPPFTFIGIDTFGPWSVVSRRTRGGSSNSKRWAVLFTCLTTRAIHIEVVEEMSASSFINAFRRFISIRGPVKQIRSDRGTNFIGSTDSLQIDAINVEDGALHHFLHNKGITWLFNPPHSSHMGGAWERLIGVTRRILDSMMMDISARNLTHEVLTTFMAEACAIVNARPIIPVSSDPDNPSILTPATLLHQKTGGQVEFLNPQQYDLKDLYKAQWKRVQTMADVFWNRWKYEYLLTLHSRRKWQTDFPNIKQNDVVLLKEKDLHRNEWPLGVIINAIPGSDDRVRKATVRVSKQGKTVTYTRPISEMVLLVSGE